MQSMIKRSMLRTYAPTFTTDSIAKRSGKIIDVENVGDTRKSKISDKEMIPLIKLLHAVYSQPES